MIIGDWSVVYKSSGYKTGKLLFPERLTMKFLEEQRKLQGTYNFNNQYENEVIADEDKKFKQNWIKTYVHLPQEEELYHFAFIDPAIGQKEHHDFTAVVVIAVSYTGSWFVRVANRYRLTPSEIVEKMFQIQDVFDCKAIGIESVAYQEALIYLTVEEMQKRQRVIPLKDISRNKVSKQSRIVSLVPRYEWGNVYHNSGLKDLEDELLTFPRGKFDDIIDSLSSLEELVFYPIRKEIKHERPHSPADPNYERWLIQDVQEHGNSVSSGDDFSEE